MRTKGGAARVEQERKSGSHACTHTRTHAQKHARTRIAPSLARKDGGQETQESVTCWSDGFVAQENSLKFPCRGPACDKK